MDTRVLWLEIIGFIFIVIVGSLLHFGFEWIGSWKPAGFLMPVNESVWEHLKMVLWPASLYAVIEYVFLKENKNFFVAKTASIYVAMIFIVAFYYFYTSILGTHILILDILTFVVSIILGQWSSYKILTSNSLSNLARKLSVVLLTLAVFLFILFTYYPPHLNIFKDPLTGGFGI